MKKTILKSVFAIVLSIVLSSCSSNNDSGSNPTPTPVTENTWSLNAYSFSRRVSNQALETTIGGKKYSIIIVDSNIETNNNNFKTCQTVFYFNTHLPGVFTIKSNATWAASDLNFMNIKCTVYDLAGKGAEYSSTDSSVTATVTSIGGKLATTAPTDIVLTKTLDDGLVNAPATITFKCDRVR